MARTCLVLCGALLSGCAAAFDPPARTDPAVAAITAAAEPIAGAPDDYDSLLELVGENRFVLLGEATHGTEEFYRERARLTRRLIEEKGFTVVAVEADWQDAYDANDYIHGGGAVPAAVALQTFERFPVWMWANREVSRLLDWLREHNAATDEERRVGFYGLDLYGVEEAIADVVAFLKAEDPAASARAAERYGCLTPFARRGMESYVGEHAEGTARRCDRGAIDQFEELTTRLAAAGGGHRPGDERLVSAWQNARVAMNGEAYYRTAATGGAASWNLRDRHMADTIDALSSHLGSPGAPAKVIVWAHNSHLGDARVTARREFGELNVGQLMRERHDGSTILIGLTTYQGTVRAADRWGGPGRVQRLKPALPESVSALFHATGIPQFVLRLRGNPHLAAQLPRTRLQRFVGVVYVPSTERQSHYFETDVARQYDAVVHIDETTAIEPLATGDR